MVLAETTGTETIYYLHGLDLVAQNDGLSTEYFGYDGLGSVRQVLDSSGSVLFTQVFDPCGNPYASAGINNTSFGFTGEQADRNRLIFLRVRYYDPAQGRFLQRDLWNDDENKLLSLNPWLYVSGNPINQTDPTGLVACKEKGGGRYCILNDGGYLDISHYRGGKQMAGDILSKLTENSRLGNENSQLSLEQSFFPKLPNYQLIYRTSIPKEGLVENELNGVALGIFMDFQIRYETFQGIDPRCYVPAIDEFGYLIIHGHCSSFSNEDLVSDYLGFVDYIEVGLSFESIIDILGGGEASSSPPSGYHPKNYKFTSFRILEVDECNNLRIVQHDLPPSLRNYQPIEAGTYWDVPKYYERIDLSNWY